jgi:hypothetical protein
MCPEFFTFISSNETWVYNCNPALRTALMKWKHHISHRNGVQDLAVYRKGVVHGIFGCIGPSLP